VHLKFQQREHSLHLPRSQLQNKQEAHLLLLNVQI
jgi:hypothetical protein